MASHSELVPRFSKGFASKLCYQINLQSIELREISALHIILSQFYFKFSFYHSYIYYETNMFKNI